MFAWSARPDDTPAHGDSAYPSAHAAKVFTNNYVDPPKKKVDAIAEAWGIHEPEPYEEFFAGGGTGRPDGDTPASSIYNGRDSHNSHSTSRSGTTPRRTKDGRDARDVYREYLEEGQQGQGNGSANRPRMATRRSVVPPPQPIFVPDASEVTDPSGSPPVSSPGFPKRSKSLMHRIRKMRDAPNVLLGQIMTSLRPLPPPLSIPTLVLVETPTQLVLLTAHRTHFLDGLEGHEPISLRQKNQNLLSILTHTTIRTFLALLERQGKSLVNGLLVTILTVLQLVGQGPPLQALVGRRVS